MKPLLTGAVGALLALGTTSAAWAQGVDEFGAYGGLDDPERTESPQHAAWEIRFGKYVPRVDSEFGGSASPYRDTFGNKFRLYFGMEFDWQALRIPSFGTLGPGIGFGFTRSKARAPLSDGSGERSGQRTTLGIFPTYLVAVLRVDVLARETAVPLVPYAKAGLGYALWWSKSGGDSARDDGGRRGRGMSYGYQFALGGMLLLDTFDPDAANEMDANTGVNNSYLFAEWYYSDLDGFDSGKLQVGTSTWMIGLALEI